MNLITIHAARVVLFSAVSVCVCVSVCQDDNSSTVRDIITKFSRHHAMVQRMDKFVNGYIVMHGW